MPLSLRDNIPLIRSFALGVAGLEFAGVDFCVTGFSETTTSSIVLGLPTFFRAENFECKNLASASNLEGAC